MSHLPTRRFVRRSVPMVLTAAATAILAAPFLAATSSAAQIRTPLASPAGVNSYHQHVLYDVSADSATDAWAVGDHYVDINHTATRTRHWNGERWHVVPSPSPSDRDNILRGVDAVSPDEAWTVGGVNQGCATLTEHWDGTAWTVVPSPNHQYSSLLSVAAVAPDDVWAVGRWSKYCGSDSIDDDLYDTLAEHWDGTSWTVVPSPEPPDAVSSNFASVSVVSADDIWAVGRTEPDNGGYDVSALVEHWDGSSWQIIPTPDLNSSELMSVTAQAADDVWAVGYVFNDDFSGAYGLIEHWDGHAWTKVTSDDSDRQTTSLSGVSGSSADDIWAVGVSQATPQGRYRSYIEHWDGSRWSFVHSPTRHGGTSGLGGVSAVSPTAAWAVGTNYRVNTSGLTQHWDGADWTEQR
jgi:hypothetical protein